MDVGGRVGLTATDLARLDRVSLRVSRARPGVTAGLRRSTRTGSSVEFADYRSYAPGDDFRRIDWKAYGRLERLLVRLYEGEEDSCLSLWVDTSASMAWDAAAQSSKQTCARTLAGALAYVALRCYDRVMCLGFADTVVARTAPLRGRRSAPRIWSMLADLPGGVGTDWTAIAAAARSVPRGIAVVLSDFLTHQTPAPAVAALRESGHDVALVQVLAPDELHPQLQGDLRLVDIETAAGVDITATSSTLAGYRAALADHTDGLRATAAAHGALFVQVDAGTPPLDLAFGPLRRAGLLR